MGKKWGFEGSRERECWGPRRSEGSGGEGSSVLPDRRILKAWETSQRDVLSVALDMAGSILQAIWPVVSEKAHPQPGHHLAPLGNHPSVLRDFTGRLLPRGPSLG